MVFKLMMETLSDTPKILTTVYAHNNRALLLVQKAISSAGIKTGSGSISLLSLPVVILLASASGNPSSRNSDIYPGSCH